MLDDSVRIAPGSLAGRAVSVAQPAEALPAEGYVLTLTAGPGPVIVSAMPGDDRARARAEATLQQLAAAGDPLPALRVTDWPELEWRGVVEGFYGEPWSHRDRLGFFAFAERVKLNDYVYAPKSDPYHRERWAEPYPDDELARIRELVAAASDHGVRFTYAIAPALSMRFADADEHRALHAKAAQLWSAGVRRFALLFDDVPYELGEADADVFGGGQAGSGAAHGEACARFQREFLSPLGVADRLLVCPTDYAGVADSPYRAAFAARLPEDALVYWTGADIVVGSITRADIDAARLSYRRDIVLWDNFPVNDFDPSRLFLGPLTGRTGDLAGSGLRGISANPMIPAAPSRFALASVADWAWDPAGYDPDRSARVAGGVVAGSQSGTLRPLVDACSAWPPSASFDGEAEGLAAAALGGDLEALDRLEERLRRLSGPAELAGGGQLGDRLADQLSPWLAAARCEAEDALDACAALRAFLTGPDAVRADGTPRTAELSSAAPAAQQTGIPVPAEAPRPRVIRPIVDAFLAGVRELVSDRSR